MKIFKNLYLILVCNKFNYLFLQLILFVLVLSLDSYDTPQNEWGVAYILRVALILLCLLMVLRFKFLNYPIYFITISVVISFFSIFHDEIINLLGLKNATSVLSNIMVQYNSESIATVVITILVVISLISEQK